MASKRPSSPRASGKPRPSRERTPSRPTRASAPARTRVDDAYERRHPPTSVPDVAVAEQRVEGLGRGAAVIAASPGLTGAERRALRGRGHALSSLVHIGSGGLTLPVASQVHEQLESHELIKVRVLESAPVSIEAAALWLHLAVEAEVPQILGRTLLLWRPRNPTATQRR